MKEKRKSVDGGKEKMINTRYEELSSRNMPGFFFNNSRSTLKRKEQLIES